MHFSDCSDFKKMCISHDSVAMQLRCGGIINNFAIANCPQSVQVKDFLKFVNICQRYGQKFSDTFLWHTVHESELAGYTRDAREWLFTFPLPPIPVQSIPIPSRSHSQFFNQFPFP